jgi:hypothetical protein
MQANAESIRQVRAAANRLPHRGTFRALELFLFGERAAGELAHAELRFFGNDTAEAHRGGGGIFPTRILHHEVVCLAGFRDPRAGGGSAAVRNDRSVLPSGAQLMGTRINGDIEIGVRLGAADPGTVDAPLRRRLRTSRIVDIVLDEINQSFSGGRLADGMLRFV